MSISGMPGPNPEQPEHKGVMENELPEKTYEGNA
jgi:hypothetical protein